MLNQILEHLAVSGVVGVIAVLFVLLFLRELAENRSSTKQHAVELAAVNERHAEELAKVRDECRREMNAEKDARISDAKATTTLAVSMHEKMHEAVGALDQLRRVLRKEADS